jgi:hypothetical protein
MGYTLQKLQENILFSCAVRGIEQSCHYRDLMGMMGMACVM